MERNDEKRCRLERGCTGAGRGEEESGGGDIWGPEAICGDIFTPLLIFNTSSRVHLSLAFLTSLLQLGATAPAVFVCISFIY